MPPLFRNDVVHESANLPKNIFSKDSSVKVWSEDKVLLREIVLDNTLNAVCFLNSRGM